MLLLEVERDGEHSVASFNEFTHYSRLMEVLMAIPVIRELLVPVLAALDQSGDLTAKELLPIVSKIVELTEADLAKTQPSGEGTAYQRVVGTLSNLKKIGYTDYQSRDGIWTWALTETGRSTLAEAEESPEAAETVTARLWAEKRKANRKSRGSGQKPISGPTRSYEQGYAAGTTAGRAEAKLLVRFWLDAHTKDGGQEALNELIRWANE